MSCETLLLNLTTSTDETLGLFWHMWLCKLILGNWETQLASKLWASAEFKVVSVWIVSLLVLKPSKASGKLKKLTEAFRVYSLCLGFVIHVRSKFFETTTEQFSGSSCFFLFFNISIKSIYNQSLTFLHFLLWLSQLNKKNAPPPSVWKLFFENFILLPAWITHH